MIPVLKCIVVIKLHLANFMSIVFKQLDKQNIEITKKNSIDCLGKSGSPSAKS